MSASKLEPQITYAIQSFVNVIDAGTVVLISLLGSLLLESGRV
jgi:hypothetical protein